MLLATALALLITGVLRSVYCSKQTGNSSTKGNHHPSFLRFWELGRRKLSMQPKFVAAQKMLLKQQTFVNGLLGFITLKHLYSAGSACTAPDCCELPIDMGNSICTAH